MDEMTFTAEQLPAVRRFAAAYAREFGLDEGTVSDLIIAINEIATNAVRHGSPTAELRIWNDHGRVVTEIRDNGHWTPCDGLGISPPAVGAEGGMGLWVARQICPDMRIQTGTHGTTVHMELVSPPRHV